MMKSMKYVFGLIFVCAQTLAMEGGQTELSIGITGKSANFTVRSIREGDAPLVASVAKQCKFTEGFPDDTEAWSTNLIMRQKAGNSFSALILETEGRPVGVVGLGRMPVLNYEPKFTDIIDTYVVEFGVTQFVNPDPENKYAKVNVVRVGDQGLATLLAILPESLGEDRRLEALKIGIDTVKFLKGSTKLPQEGTTPAYLIGLYHPSDPLIALLEKLGFKTISKKGLKVIIVPRPLLKSAFCRF